MTPAPIIVWFRNDLRLRDHPALAAAVASGAQILPVFVLDEAAAGRWRPGGASQWWLHQSLAALSSSIAARGGRLILRQGRTVDVLADLAAEAGAGAVYFSRAYEPWAARLEGVVKEQLQSGGIEVRRFAGALLREPEEVRTKSGEPFRVYTPFWRALVAMGPPSLPASASGRSLKFVAPTQASDRLEAWNLVPAKPDWAGGMRAAWQPGEAGGAARLDEFLATTLATYGEDRNFPGRAGTSRLSPHLHFGEVSPRRVWLRAADHAAAHRGMDGGLETFLKELVWRDFSYHLLVHWPDLPENPFRPEFDKFPWREDRAALRAWQQGRTGYPIVDAGMRELWHTGYMHNRVRMIVASFLVKHLLLAWQDGEAWFWDTLVDADLASNAASWQWVAGSGADAAPYFRIFNPVLQAEKFDPDGSYVRRWVGELKDLPPAVIHAPWTAPEDVLARAGVVLGQTYPFPVVDHQAARQRALAAFQALKKNANERADPGT